MSRAVLIHRCKHQAVEGGLTVWPFTQVTIKNPHLGPMTSPATVLWLVSHYLEWIPFHPIRESLVTSLTAMLLLHHWAYLAWQIGILANREEIFWEVLAWFCYAVQLKCLMSLTTDCYHLVVVENRSNSDSVAVRSSCSLGTALSTHSGYLCELQILHRLLNRDLRRLFHSSLVWVNPPPLSTFSQSEAPPTLAWGLSGLHFAYEELTLASLHSDLVS